MNYGTYNSQRTTSANTTGSTCQQGDHRSRSPLIQRIFLSLLFFSIMVTITNLMGHPVLVPVPWPDPLPCPSPSPVPSPDPVVLPDPIPWPGSTYIIRDRSSGKVITRRGDQLIIDEVDHKGGQEWYCLETNGWLGFRNPTSGKYLGHDHDGKLRAQADDHHSWERFDIRQHPDGGYILLLTHFENLWYVGGQGTRELAKLPDRLNAMQWDFVEV